MLFNFYIEKKNDKVLLTHYQLFGDKEWMKVLEEFQDFENHQKLSEIPAMKRAIEGVKEHRTVRINLNDDDAEVYKIGSLFDQDGSSESILTEDINEVSKEKTDIHFENFMQQMFEAQNKNMQLMMKTFAEMLKSSNDKRIKMTVNKFDGKTEDAKSWLITYEKACSCNNWSTDELKINNMKSNLEGIALKWFNNRIIEQRSDDWQEWKTSFSCSFSQNRIQLLNKAMKFEYRAGSLLEYFYEKQRLINLAFQDIQEYNFISIVILGLPSQMQTQILTMEISTRDQFRKALECLKPQTFEFKDRTIIHEKTEENKKDHLDEYKKPSTPYINKYSKKKVFEVKDAVETNDINSKN